MQVLHGEYAPCPVVEQKNHTYMGLSSAARFPPPLSRRCVPSLVEPMVLHSSGSALPSGALFLLPAPCEKRMADMSDTLLSTSPLEFICPLVAAAFPNSSSLGFVSRHPDRVETSSLHRSTGRAHPPPALCPLLERPCLRTGPFLFWRTARALTECRCSQCMAGMYATALLTKRSKSISLLVAGTPLRILLPRTRVRRHRTEAVSSSLGLGSPARCNPPPCTRALLSIWLRPYHKAPTSVGASFFCPDDRICMAAFPKARLPGRDGGRILNLTTSAAFRGCRPSKVRRSGNDP
jgi:hypothetical protein